MSQQEMIQEWGRKPLGLCVEQRMDQRVAAGEWWDITMGKDNSRNQVVEFGLYSLGWE